MTRLTYIIRQAPFSVAHLLDQDVDIDFREVTDADDRVAIAPLTDNEQWTPLPPDTLALFERGAPPLRNETRAHCATDN